MLCRLCYVEVLVQTGMFTFFNVLSPNFHNLIICCLENDASENAVTVMERESSARLPLPPVALTDEDSIWNVKLIVKSLRAAFRQLPLLECDLSLWRRDVEGDADSCWKWWETMVRDTSLRLLAISSITGVSLCLFRNKNMCNETLILWVKSSVKLTKKKKNTNFS